MRREATISSCARAWAGACVAAAGAAPAPRDVPPPYVGAARPHPLSMARD